MQSTVCNGPGADADGGLSSKVASRRNWLGEEEGYCGRPGREAKTEGMSESQLQNLLLAVLYNIITTDTEQAQC